MKIKWIVAACLLAGAFAACEKKLLDEDLDLVDDLALATGSFDSAASTVTSEIFELAEGIVEYGHVWATTNNPTYENNEGIDNKGILENAPASFSSTVEGIAAGQDFFYRAFAKDRLGCLHYGLVENGSILDAGPCNVTADFTIGNDGCSAACTVTLKSTSVNALQFIWEIDGLRVTTSSADTIAFYGQGGSYPVKLIAVGEHCRDSITRTVHIQGAVFDTVYTGYREGEKVVVTPQGYTIIGNIGTTGGSSSGFMLQMDKQGNILPSSIRSTVFKLSAEDFIEDAIQLANRNYVIVGSALVADPVLNKDIYYLLTDENGNPMHGPEAVHVSDGADVAYGVIEDAGRVVVVGSSEKKIYALKTRADRLSENFSNALNTGHAEDVGYDIAALGGTLGYAIVGLSQLSAGGNFQGSYTRISDNGALISGTFPLVYPAYGRGEFTAIAHHNGQLLSTGISHATDANGNAAVLKTAPEGTLHNAPFDQDYGVAGQLEKGFDLLPLADGSLIIAGNRAGDAMLMKIDPSGSVLWTRSFGSGGIDYFNSVALTDDGGFIATGSKDGVLLVVKTSSEGIAE